MNSFGRMALLVSAIGLAALKCGKHESNTTYSSLAPVITETKYQKLLLGGYCIAPEGKTVAEACGEKGKAQTEGLEKYIPKAAFQNDVVAARTKDGFVFRMTLGYEGLPKIPDDHFAIIWRVYIEKDGESNLDLDRAPALLKRLEKTCKTINVNERQYYRSESLAPGHRYTFYVVGQVHRYSEPAHLLVFAELVYGRIVVDLTGAQLPK